MTPSGPLRLHSSTVAFAGPAGWAALVICGASGSGKSELALSLMGLGARLVADDQTEFVATPPDLVARAPATLSGLIEMRFMGLLRADPIAQAPVRAMVDLDQRELHRLPVPRMQVVLGIEVPLFHRIDSPAFASALRQYMLHPDPAFGP